MSAPGRATIVVVFAVLCAIWGSTWAVIRIGLRGVPPFSGVALRFAIASVVLGLLALAFRLPLGRTRRERALWWVNGVLAFSVSYGVVYWSEQWVPSGLTAVLFATYPLFVAIISHFILPEEALSRAELIGVIGGFAGVGLIFSEDLAALGGPQVAIASAVMLLSPSASALSSVAIKRWGAGVHPLSLTAVPMAICACLTGAVALSTERELTFSWNRTSIGALLYLALAGSAVTFTLYYWLLSHLPAKRLALIAYIIPVEAVLIGVFLGERLTPRILAGSILVVFGVALAVHRRGRRSPRTAGG
ncbi:MAG TPA: EamA family transporter [Candidatus Polarisedimenticolaceae bacterium]|nr:EamA family transporter [Candidatus Polarisedimenticolaceae bacterium]